MNHDIQTTRSGCKDIWNAFMFKDIFFTDYDIPYCPTTTDQIPKDIITYSEAKEIYSKELKAGNISFHRDVFVCWYEDDYKFDGSRGIWQKPYNAEKILNHFEGIITPDWSTYQDFAFPLKIYNIYRSRAFGYWYGKLRGKKVINNVRWGTEETYSYCFNGLPLNSIYCIGCVASNLKNRKYRQIFINGLLEMIERLHPKVIITYGSINDYIRKIINDSGIILIEIKSRTAKYFEGRR